MDFFNAGKCIFSSALCSESGRNSTRSHHCVICLLEGLKWHKWVVCVWHYYRARNEQQWGAVHFLISEEKCQKVKFMPKYLLCMEKTICHMQVGLSKGNNFEKVGWIKREQWTRIVSLCHYPFCHCHKICCHQKWLTA